MAPALLLLAAACEPVPPPAAPATSWLTSRLLDPQAGRPAEVHRLRVALAVPASAEQRFRLLRRLGIYLSFSSVPDSGAAPLRAAARLGAGLRPPLPLEQASVLSRLAQLHWQHQQYDSARSSFAQAAQILHQAFPDSAALAAPRQLDGLPVMAGVALAGNYANAGLAWQAVARLPAALRYYDLARRAYQLVPDAAPSKLSGLAWVHTLFAEALQQQNEPTLAARHYEQALAALRTLRRYNWPDALQEWAAILPDYAPYLLPTAPRHLHALATENQAELSRRLQVHPHDRDLLANASHLALWDAQAYLVLHDRAAGAALSRAAALLSRLRPAAGPEFRAELGYYSMAAQLAQLQAGRAAALGDQLARARLTALALAYHDSVPEAGRRNQLGLTLAREWVRQNDYPAALALLRPLRRRYTAAHEPQALSQTWQLLATAYARQGHYDSAFQAQGRAVGMADTLRGRQQRTAVAEAETRYRTSVKEIRIGELTEDARQERRQSRLAWLSAALLTLLLGSVGYALWHARRLARRLREARATQDRLYSIIGHDLRTPLTALEGLATLLDYYRQPDQADPAALAEITSEVRQTTSQLTGLLDNLLHWAANQSGELAYHPERLDAAALLHESADLYAPAARARQVVVQVELPGTPPVLWADRNMVLTQLRNLLGNALRVAPPGSTITLTARTQAGQTELAVTDAGPGLSPAQLAALESEGGAGGLAPRLPGQRGTGLGLPLVRQLARRQQGTFALDSQPGQGTTARLGLPLGAA